ncbi:hypothetical protein SAMN05216338_101084 [Bradyrhizobium sp. Rc2d]|uniref:hypothetical protein n=1 Tax=Bradyrhizobium sp. Rc2d TaxID=1855321 RepID=UPI00089066DD|nr:hypothetical protein [Bradyrhizobium sp. Rc2d]SDH52851.1 hypothetical protein SAMN05216338_101084 [Bradyrhizobium sp. Rc2d]
MKELRRALLEAVGVRVGELGYKYKPKQQAYWCPFSQGRSSLHLAFIDHRDDFDIVADVAVRFDKLEIMINANNAMLSKSEKLQTYSLGAELGNISGQDQMRWNVTSSADVEPVADRLVAALKEIGIPYLDRASTLEGAYELLSSAALHSPIHLSRAKHIVGLAKLLGRTDELSARARESVELLEGTKDAGLQDFKRFVASLDAEV